MSKWQVRVHERLISPEEATAKLRNAGHIALASGCSEPVTVLKAIVREASHFSGLRFYNMALGSICPYAANDFSENFRLVTILPDPSLREAITRGTVEYLPVSLSAFPAYLRRLQTLDAALIQVSSPDRHGYCSLGLSVDYTRSAALTADLVIAEINTETPRTLGESFLHVSQIDYFVHAEQGCREFLEAPVSVVERRVAEHVAELVPNGSTVQFGIGSIARAIADKLQEKEELGIHTGIFTDAVMDLVESGAVSNRHKGIDTYKCVVTQVLGSTELYQYVSDNPGVEMRSCEYTHNYAVLTQLENFVAINSAVEVDLTGQVNAEYVNGKQISGTGGQLDFMHAASQSSKAKSVIALTSTAASGKISRIVHNMSPGAVVSTPRVDVDYVVTEFGIASLSDKTIRERTEAMIAVAHPAFRKQLSSLALGY